MTPNIRLSVFRDEKDETEAIVTQQQASVEDGQNGSRDVTEPNRGFGNGEVIAQ